MSTAAPKPAPRPQNAPVGAVTEAVAAHGEGPEASEETRAELLASLRRGDQDREAGRVTRMGAEEFFADMRSRFERITGYKSALP